MVLGHAVVYMPELPLHLVQELNVGTVFPSQCATSEDDYATHTTEQSMEDPSQPFRVTKETKMPFILCKNSLK